MAKYPMLSGLLLGCWLGLHGVAYGQASNAPSAATVLQFKPGQADVALSTPAKDEVTACKVKEIRAGGAIVGWELIDGKGSTLRKFFDSKGGKNIDTWSYFKDGHEVYRELDSNGDGKADQFRWLNAGGMKWGVDVNGDGRIDAWRLISAEELGHEMFQALATQDFGRFQALMITEAEVRALKLGSAQAGRILKLQAQAKAQFAQAMAKNPNLTAEATYLRIESGPPQCIPADAFGGEQDLIKYPTRSILYETGQKKHDWLQTGEMLKVGAAWRVVEVALETPPTQQPGNPQLQKLLVDLDVIDKAQPALNGPPKRDSDVQGYNRKRVAVVKQIIQVVDAKDKETWWKQLFDNLNAGAQAGDDAALKELSGYRAQLETSMKGANLTAYATYRELWAIYAPQIANPAIPPKDLAKLQEEWQDKLGKFVQAYPKAEDTPDALHQLAINAEFSGQDETAKRWYRTIHANFPEHHFAEKAKGAERRLDLVGRNLELQGSTLSGQGYDISQSKGKVVVVYYYASYVPVSIGDFARLKQIMAKHANAVDLVCVNLDDTDKAAKEFVNAHNPIGVHLFEAKQGAVGQNSRLAVHYGINGLPTMFLVGRDGRVLSRTLQIGDLEEALRKAL